MSDSDGIQISDKPSWEHSGRELFAILGKRLIALPSKMLGFKPFCLYLATWLLAEGYIRDWIWFAVVVMVLFGIVGLKILAQWRYGNERFLERSSYRGRGGGAGGADGGYGDSAPRTGPGDYGTMGGGT
jgi:hypothetical protein